MPEPFSAEIPEFPSFRPVCLADRPVFEEKLAILDRRSCECAFANILLWSEPYKIECARCGERLLLLERDIGSLHFPIGEYLPPAELAELVRTGLRAGSLKNGDVYDTPEEYPAAFPELGRHFDSAAEEDNFDYLYELARLVEMSGPLLRKKRNLVRQFERLHPAHRIVPITPDNLDDAIELSYSLNGRLVRADFLELENRTLETARRYFTGLEMGGIMLLTNGEAVGLSIYSKLNSDTYDVHFEKVDHHVKGAPQAMVQQLAIRLLAAGGVYLNREQDMGEPGLRQAKRSLDPCGYERRIELTLKQA